MAGSRRAGSTSALKTLFARALVRDPKILVLDDALARHAEPLEELSESPLRLAEQLLVAEHVFRATMGGEGGLDDLRSP